MPLTNFAINLNLIIRVKKKVKICEDKLFLPEQL